AGSIFMVGFYKYLDSHIETVAPPTGSGPEPTAVSGLCRTVCTYLILGDDSRKGLSKADRIRFGSSKTVPGQRSDTILLVRLDPREQKAIVLSFPRDLWVNI